jgi:hypothetical protein
MASCACSMRNNQLIFNYITQFRRAKDTVKRCRSKYDILISEDEKKVGWGGMSIIVAVSATREVSAPFLFLYIHKSYLYSSVVFWPEVRVKVR